jgi:hypothetical protein
VVGEEGQVDLQRPPVLLFRLAVEELIEIALRGVVLDLRRHRFQPLPQAEERRQDAGELRGQSDRLVEIGDVVELLAGDGAESGNAGAESIHRRRGRGEITNDVDHVLG